MASSDDETRESSEISEHPGFITAVGDMLEESLDETAAELVGDGEENWQTECPDPASRLGAMLARRLWLDCEVIVGSTKESVQAHRIVLASASPVLAKMLDRNPRLIAVPNITLETFKIVLQFIYTNKVDLNSCEIAFTVFEAAHFLLLPSLNANIKDYLLLQVTEKCVLKVYELAKKFDNKELAEKCLGVMETKTEEVLMGSELVTVRADTLEAMFAMEHMNVSSELLLLKAADRWVRARCENFTSTTLEDRDRGEGDAPLAKKYKDEEGTAVLSIRNAIQKIRFLALTPKEFADCDTTSLLLSSEIAAIALNLNSSETYMPMPAGFSLERKNREIRTKVYKLTVPIGSKVDVPPLIGDRFNWKIEILLQNQNNSNYYNSTPQYTMSVALYCGIDKVPYGRSSEWFCDADFEVSFLGNEKCKLLFRGPKKILNGGCASSEYISRRELEKDFIRNNMCTLELKIMKERLTR